MVLFNIQTKTKHITVPPEILLDNKLEKDIKKMMYPVNLMLSLFLSSKYSIKDDYVIPKRKVVTTLAFFCVIFMYGLGINRLFIEELEGTMGKNTNYIVTSIFGFFGIYYLVAFTILFILNIVHSDFNISIVLLIQRIYKDLEFSGSLKRVVRLNWISILSSVNVNIFLQSLFYGIYNDFNWSDLMFDLMFIIFDINLVYAILVIVLLRKYLEKWIEDVLTVRECGEKKCVFLYRVYQNILEAYHLYKKIFRILILFHTADTFFRSICYFGICLQILEMSAAYSEEEMTQFSVTISVAAIWLTKDIVLVILQSVFCEKFYATIEEAETACIQRLKNINYLDCEETLCGNVIQINRGFFSKMTACGLFYIDARLPLELIGLLTSYIVVMLQSAFL